METLSSKPLETQVRSIVDDRHLLGHPFYVAWSKGELSHSQLKQYAGQYMHHVLAEPTYLSAVHSTRHTLQVMGKAISDRGRRSFKTWSMKNSDRAITRLYGSVSPKHWGSQRPTSQLRRLCRPLNASSVRSRSSAGSDPTTPVWRRSTRSSRKCPRSRRRKSKGYDASTVSLTRPTTSSSLCTGQRMSSIQPPSGG